MPIIAIFSITYVYLTSTLQENTNSDLIHEN